MWRRIAPTGFAVLLALTVAGCSSSGHATSSAASSTTEPRGTTSAPRSTVAPTPTTADVPVPTTIQANGSVTTKCLTLPANWPMCATVNASGAVATFTTVDSHTAVLCLDSTVEITGVPRGEYSIACRVLTNGKLTKANAGALPGHPLLCSLVNGGTFVAGKATPSALRAGSLVCFDTLHSTAALYRPGAQPSPCQLSGRFVDCRPTP